MKKVILILVIGFSFNVFSQIPDGVYGSSYGIFYLKNNFYYQISVVNFIDLKHIAKLLAVVDSGKFTFNKNNLEFFTLNKTRFGYKFKNIKFIDSGFYGTSIENVTIYFIKSIQTEISFKDSAKKINEINKLVFQKISTINNKASEIETPYWIELTNTCNGKKKLIKQSKELEIVRIKKDKIFEIETYITQTINGYIVAINDSFVSIKTSYFTFNNDYNKNYEFVWNLPQISANIDYITEDTVLTFPINEMYMIKQEKTKYLTFSGIMITAAITNQLLSPLYCINYKNNIFNKKLFRTVSFVNIGAFITGLLNISFHKEKQYPTRVIGNFTTYYQLKLVD